ncbi:MAG TPA: nucleotidyltransferase domain-containing protein [Candidatus Saccharimonadales bacterium]|nr:nucleotidyltransferase domain-containing protein [Candidatus Saccharimonadales bacterium]
MDNKQETPPKIADTRSNLDKLNSGLLMLGVKREMDEPEYQVLGQQTFTHHAIQSQHTYSSEVIRVLNELKLTTALMAEVEDRKEVGGAVFEPEEVITYYSGVFFDLVHQLKDKLFQLIAAITIDLNEPLKARYRDLSGKQIQKFLEANQQKLTELDIYDLLAIWRKEDGPIGITLYRRTQHHHFRSRLQLNHDFQQLKMSRIMLDPIASGQLTEYGRQRMAEIGQTSFKKLKDDTVDKQRKTTSAIEANLNCIADKLVEGYKVPTNQLEQAKIGAAYTEHLGSLQVPANEASKDKIPSEVKPLIDGILQLASDLGDQVVSVYLVGSVGRGEFVAGVSDINFYVITKNQKPIAFDSEKPLTLMVLSEKDFLSQEHQKDRFVCWSDGVLLSGTEFTFSDKDFPKPGTLLTLLLNRDAIDRLEAMKTEITNLQSPSALQLRLYSIKLSRIILDYAFGVAMANKPSYTASRKKKISYAKEAFPNDRLILTMEQVYYKGIVKQADLAVIIDAFLKNNRKNYEKMLDIEKKVNEASNRSS